MYFESFKGVKKGIEEKKSQEFQVSISPTFYEQLLHTKIPKAQKDTNDLTVFLHFWDLRAKSCS